MAGYETTGMRRRRARLRFSLWAAAHRLKRQRARRLARWEEPVALDAVYGDSLTGLLPPLLSELLPSRRRVA